MRRALAALAALAASTSISTVTSTASADVEVDGRRIEVIDLHLHPGSFGRLAVSGRAFIVSGLPPFARLYAPALIDRLLDPYAPHVGIRAQADWAGVDRVLLFAVYTPESTGYFENEALDDLLSDPRNDRDGAPWAAGLSSIDFSDWSTPGVPAQRLAALESWLEVHPERHVGIKLAHAHQAVTFDDPAYLGVYEVAARQGVPVLLHTGFSPFPGTRTEPAYYDPEGLTAIAEAYDGAHGMGRVELVLSHVGQGDARAIEHALELAATHDNVWLELSALDRPLSIDADGMPVDATEPQLPWVITRIRERGLIERTVFATDGPQFSGMVRRYVGRVIETMRAADYELDEIEAVMGGNARRLFFR